MVIQECVFFLLSLPVIGGTQVDFVLNVYVLLVDWRSTRAAPRLRPGTVPADDFISDN